MLCTYTYLCGGGLSCLSKALRKAARTRSVLRENRGHPPPATRAPNVHICNQHKIIKKQTFRSNTHIHTHTHTHKHVCKHAHTHMHSKVSYTSSGYFGHKKATMLEMTRWNPHTQGEAKTKHSGLINWPL